MKRNSILHVFGGWILGSLLGSAFFYIPIVLSDIFDGKASDYSGTSDWLLGLLFMFQLIFMFMIPGVIGAAFIRASKMKFSCLLRSAILTGLGLVAATLAGLLDSKFFPPPSFTTAFGHIVVTLAVSNLGLLPFTAPKTGVEQAGDLKPDHVAS